MEGYTLFERQNVVFMSFSAKNALLLLFLLVTGSSFAAVFSIPDKHARHKNTVEAEDNSAYKIVQDTIINNGIVEIHADTILNKKYQFRKVIVSTDKVADTIWQDANVFSVNYRTINHYDYVPTDPAYGYTGKIKLTKPYSFFRPSEVLNKSRVGMVAGMEGGIYAIANVWWSTAWYSKTEKTKFHFFNDWGEWNQMDKIGHAYSCYIESKWTYDLFHWAGVKEKNAIWIGMLTGNLWQLSIELNDGFQKKWGFSWGDMSMNVSGSLLFGIQQYLWHEQRITMKMSAFPVNYNKYNDPEIKERADKLYGTSFTESLLKDYNAMTLWWSVSPGAFIRNPTSKFPKCLQVSFGYGAGGMLGGYKNRWSKKDLSGDEDLSTADPADIVDRSDIQRTHRFYLSFDIDWTKLPVKKHWAKGLMKVLNVIKLPAPAIEFNDSKSSGKVVWHWLKF